MTTTRWFQYFLLFLLCSLCALPTFAASNSLPLLSEPPRYYGFIEGVTYRKLDDKNLERLAYATVSIPEKNFSLQSDSNGIFLIGVALDSPREYITISVSKSGFGSTTITHSLLGAGFMRRYKLVIEPNQNITQTESVEENARIPSLDSPPLYAPTSFQPTPHPNNNSKNTLFGLNNPHPETQDVFTVAWFFAEPDWETGAGYGYGEGDHFGDDYYAYDYNWGYGGNLEAGKYIYAAFPGKVVYVKDDYPVCNRNVCWYGNQVVIQNGSLAIRYTHLMNVFVKPGQEVNVLDPIATLGHSGLSGQCPYCEHLHVALYKNLDRLSRRLDTLTGQQRSGEYWLQYGGIPECMMFCYNPTQFAARFELTKKISLDFSTLFTPTAETLEAFQLNSFFTPLPTTATSIPFAQATASFSLPHEQSKPSLFNFLFSFLKFLLPE